MVHLPPGFEPPTITEDESSTNAGFDEGVRAVLPEGAKVKRVRTFGTSQWAKSSMIVADLPNGARQSYFLKVYHDKKARDMARGEYEGSKALYNALPANVPKPVATGCLAGDPTKHFYLAEFRDMADELPNIVDLAPVMIKLHQTTSPTGKFGFHVITYGGNFPVDTTWCDTWEEFFTRMMRDTMKTERLIRGPDKELDGLCPLILESVIPRLLRPFESNEEQVKPVLIHGDLWHGNIAIDDSTNSPVLFDPCAFYAPFEFDFALWTATRYNLRPEDMKEYYIMRDINSDDEEQKDRQALYAIRTDLMVSITWPNFKSTRQLAIDGMKQLVEKYCNVN